MQVLNLMVHIIIIELQGLPLTVNLNNAVSLINSHNCK